MNTKKRINDWLLLFNRANILCVGDVMLDQYVYGEVDRVSPEAPIPVLNVGKKERAIGGAGNVVCNIASLGSVGYLLAEIGNDEAGEEIGRLLKTNQKAVPKLLINLGKPTTLKTRFIADGQQLLRSDEESINGYNEAFSDKIITEFDSIINNNALGAIVLSDYGKGVLTDKVITEIISTSKSISIPIIVDPKGSNFTKYTGADILTPNRKELGEATQMSVNNSEEIVEACNKLIEITGVTNVLVTRGSMGMSLISKDDKPFHLPALAREIYDVSGAGDTVVAVLATGLSVGMEIRDAATLANIAAGLVVSKVGTAVVNKSDLESSINAQRGSLSNIYDENNLMKRIAQWRSQNLKIGFTNGCFDVIHPGHISLLDQASSQCDRLVIGVNSDSSIKRLKGTDRPIQDEISRSQILASLANVDAVVIFEDDTPIELIQLICPDVLIKGADYKVEQVVGAEFVQSYEGKVFLATLLDGFSTTDIINRLLN
ncbi:MAG: bifunctional heptose 7-phosphate kinase/heptose 1-phosphate adenyltransferase [Alphaproteobacteria bacterium]|nr:bifunctional heptose 7-phosphate kinase/heptose 1-phosphate adenyltransferase [Alphaproteobacteria bacterium]PPR14188.1 MAG: Bifunctional protein HldE [Alphaproteobacteria bacterium MarineAlpha12_Bin1]|tara:strand:- start:1349 stop:2812 length:1464 start_codon:yes stop_codon:yes gene_type:complete